MRNEVGYLICQRHSLRSTPVENFELFSKKKDLFSFSRVQRVQSSLNKDDTHRYCNNYFEKHFLETFYFVEYPATSQIFGEVFGICPEILSYIYNWYPARYLA